MSVLQLIPQTNTYWTWAPVSSGLLFRILRMILIAAKPLESYPRYNTEAFAFSNLLQPFLHGPASRLACRLRLRRSNDVSKFRVSTRLDDPPQWIK
jgi:hypothetical protein